MSHFSSDAFQARAGRLSQLIVEQPDSDEPTRLQYSLEVEFDSFESEESGEEFDTRLWISGLRVPGLSWKALENWSSEGAEPVRFAKLLPGLPRSEH